MKLSHVLGVAVAVAPTLASPYGEGLFRREDAGTCKIQLASSNGGRKVGIVIDSSGSMSYNDPADLRILAGKTLNSQLVPASGAAGGKKGDLVTVVDFDSSASVIYPLGDPAGAGSSFDTIDSNGGTYIADGVTKALGEITKPGNDPTADRSGIIVLTDGEDSDVSALISAIEACGTAGVRVSFGFLAVPDTFFEPDLLTAILKTGGSYASFATSEAIQSWLFLILSNGLTASDTSASAEQPLLPGITVAKLTGANPVTFNYAAQGGEDVVFTIESLSNQALDAELKDGTGASLGKNGTAKGPASIAFSSKATGDLKLVVSSTNSTAEGVFQVNLNSSLGISGCNLTTIPNNNGSVTTPTPSPTPTQTHSVVTAAAATFGFPALGLALAAALL